MVQIKGAENDAVDSGIKIIDPQSRNLIEKNVFCKKLT